MTSGQSSHYARIGKLLGVIALAFCVVGITGRSGFDNPCEPGETNCVELQTRDFSPRDGTWDINWPGPPRADLTFNNAERFTINLQLDRNAPRTFSRDFLISADRTFGRQTLGRFTATFAMGSRTPTISYPSECCGAERIPAGTPANLTDGTFWMGCTKEGRVKANGPRDDDQHARIRLEKVNKSDSVGVKHKYSPDHDVNCR
jgi:hypothetical protein